MKIWIDAQLSPAIAAWINRSYEGIEAHSVRAVGLRDALDAEIFEQAKKQDVVIMSKDDDFTKLVAEKGPPPQIIWVTCGNTSNEEMRKILSKTLLKARKLPLSSFRRSAAEHTYTPRPFRKPRNRHSPEGEINWCPTSRFFLATTPRYYALRRNDRAFFDPFLPLRTIGGPFLWHSTGAATRDLPVVGHRLKCNLRAVTNQSKCS